MFIGEYAKFGGEFFVCFDSKADGHRSSQARGNGVVEYRNSERRHYVIDLASDAEYITINMKEFWFPIFLFLAGVIAGFVGLAATANGRRVLYSFSVLLCAAAILSYIWGDPVTGPFANLIKETPKEFVFQAGVTCHFPVRQLAEGIDFSNCLDIRPINPVEVWVSKTWWSGTRIRLTLKEPDGKPYFIFKDGRVVLRKPHTGDFNHDDHAIEFVTENRVPYFQLVIANDLSRIYVNAVIPGATTALILRGESMFNVDLRDVPKYNLYRIFKYPSDIHEGERNPDAEI